MKAAQDFRQMLREIVARAAIRKAGAVSRQNVFYGPPALSRTDRRNLRAELRRHAGNATKAAASFPDEDRVSFRQQLRALKESAVKRHP